VALPFALLAGFIAFQVLRPETPKVQSTAPVQMTARQLGERQATMCRSLIAKLPLQVRDRARRPVTAGQEQNAAFGDPAITVACGAPAATYRQEDTVYPLNNVCWFADAEGTRWRTVDREVPIEVTVPSGYDSPGQWVINFSGPVEASIPPAKAPWGCTGG
jgi:hypothetical protein